jgi:radical SAM superfamily enzyme YgiQ (UPF0313 family)
MKQPMLVSLERPQVKHNNFEAKKILLIKPPYFTPWTPPLGIAILKSYLQQHGYSVSCLDLNVDPDLWGMHHKYFAALQQLEDVSINDGYSKLWWILNAHLLAFVNGASPADCAGVVGQIAPMYGVRYTRSTLDTLNTLVEQFFNRLNKLIDEANVSRYALVGASSYTTSLASSLFILNKVKHAHPHVTTVMGGGVFADDLALESDNLETLVNEYPEIDHIILGEGELLFLKLLEGELSHLRVISIANLKGVTLNMRDVPLPDFSDLNFDNYYHLTIEGARSCPFQCSFCSETIQWGDYRKKPIDIFVQQVIDLAERYRNNSFFMGDSLMNPYIMQFSSELLKTDKKIIYDGYLRADKPVANRKWTKQWARSGCFRVRLGIESASTRILKAMDKMTTPKTISEALKSLAAAGIRTTTYWITGFPGETEEDFQETLDFIREHHRYIYELEAHAYYYYPYGQVGSRLHQCRSLYSDEVNRFTKFKVWDIEGVTPPREERFDRQRRISDLASELGLPNIYTMSERYAAEDRWRSLYPLAAEVYQGAHPHRYRPQPVSRPLPVFTDESDLGNDTGLGSILRYRATVNKELEERPLNRAIEEMFLRTQMLQVKLRAGKYIALSDKELEIRRSMLSARIFDKGDQELAEVIAMAVERLDKEIHPGTGVTFQVALIKGDNGSNEILLLAHSAVVDGKSITLLFEMLFRFYEQLSNDVSPSIRPVEKEYADFINCLEVGDNDQGEAKESFILEGDQARRLLNGSSNIWGAEGRSSEIFFDRKLTDQIFSHRVSAGWRPTEIALIAILKAIRKEGLLPNITANVRIDHRSVDSSLAQTVGALTRVQTISLPAIDAICLTPTSWEIRALLAKDLASCSRSPNKEEADVIRRPVLIDLEYCMDDPWLGGDEWAPRGFILDRKRSNGFYLLEIALVYTEEGLQAQIKYCALPEIVNVVNALKQHLSTELEHILEEVSSYIAAKKFWAKEFAQRAPASNIELDCEGQSGRGRSSLNSALENGPLISIQAACGAQTSEVILSAFSVLLSRLTGREDVVIVTSLIDAKSFKVFPLRLYPIWEYSYENYMQVLREKIAYASRYAGPAFDIIGTQLGMPDGDRPYPALDVACIFCDGPRAESATKLTEQVLLQHHGLGRQFDLALEVSKQNAMLQINAHFNRERLDESISGRLMSYLNSILRQAADNPKISLGAIEIVKGQKSNVIAESFSREEFRF